MRPQRITVQDIGTSAWVPLDYRQAPFNVSIAVTTAGTSTYSVEHTFDDIYDPAIVPVAFPSAGMTGILVNKDSNYAFPIRAARLVVTAGTGLSVLTMLQGNR